MAHYLITGHTGFKGAWLVFLLKAQGHDVSGLALDPLPGSIFGRTSLESDLVHDFRVDIRNRDETVEAIRHAQPDYVIHMAAQALVREGYRNPRYTYETNVLGTLNVLEAVDQTDSVRAQLIVTTDKVYLDQGLNRPYIETDPLGGKDPYSASKAMADILTQEYLSRDGAKPGAIARAGNVIGAGDVSNERLIPDIVRAIEADEPLVLRYPEAIRPWQHVLDCLGGYLALLTGVDKSGLTGEFNFGPQTGSFASVQDVVIHIQSMRRLETQQDLPKGLGSMVEDTYLVLDSEKARNALGWNERFGFKEAVDDASQALNALSASSIRSLINETIYSWTRSPVGAHISMDS
jgi:CDP-glucose 4,6-dehydratase